MSFRRLRKDSKRLEDVIAVTEELKNLYYKRLLPIEKRSSFHLFHSPSYEDADFDNKPMVLVMGQYSTGKTTFIRYLIEQDFPGSRVGPEPTTDCFTALMYGEAEGMVPGNALTMDPKKPFRNLDPFGNTFLNRIWIESIAEFMKIYDPQMSVTNDSYIKRSMTFKGCIMRDQKLFQCVQIPNPVLESISIIDTPGILTAAKKKLSRGYDFPAVLRWFAERVDRIILLFDAHKLEFSDELTRAFGALYGHEDKLRVVLNKADSVDSQELMRVYGALMWSLGKVFRTPEIFRVYIGSFWSEQRLKSDHIQLIELEEEDLLADIRNLPHNAALRRLNDLVKRARLVRAHAHIISYLKQEMPTLFCKESKKQDLIYQLPVIFSKIQQQQQIPAGDFPDCTKMQERLLRQNFSKFKTLKPNLMASLDRLLSTDISNLVPLLQRQEIRKKPLPGVLDGEFLGTFRRDCFSRHPFKEGPKGDQSERDFKEWVVEKYKPKYDEIFYNLGPNEGKLSGSKVKKWMTTTLLPNSVLAHIWRLSDVDEDGMLDNEEFALAVHLVEGKLEGHWLPRELPSHLVPPSKRLSKASEDS